MGCGAGRAGRAQRSGARPAIAGSRSAAGVRGARRPAGRRVASRAGGGEPLPPPRGSSALCGRGQMSEIWRRKGEPKDPPPSPPTAPDPSCPRPPQPLPWPGSPAGCRRTRPRPRAPSLAASVPPGCGWKLERKPESCLLRRLSFPQPGARTRDVRGKPLPGAPRARA